MTRFGNEVNFWLETKSGMDISRGAKKVSSISTTTFQVTFDPKRSALIVIDMQNYFCSERLGRSDIATNLSGAILKSVKHAREIGMRIIWLNWGVRPDLANLPPGVLRSFYRSGIYAGFGAELEGGMGPILTKTSWSADLIPELNEARSNEDIWVDKYRTSGFYGTELEQILMAQGITTLLFAGVNTDQCVFGTLQDAHCLGYDCVLLTDCTATSSPVGAYESVVYNVERGYGFATSSKEFCDSI